MKVAASTRTVVSRPVPEPDADSAPFWEACARNELLAQRCTACGRWRHPPGKFCPRCHGTHARWIPLDGHGVIRSYVVVHRVALAGFADDVPYVIARVELSGSSGEVVLATNVIDCEPAEMRVGLPIEIVFTRSSERIVLPQCRPVRSNPVRPGRASE